MRPPATVNCGINCLRGKFLPDPQGSVLIQEDLESLNYYCAWSGWWQLCYLQRAASPLSSWLHWQSAGLMVTRYFYTICMMESRASLPWSSVIKAAIEKLLHSSSQDKRCLCALHFSKLRAHLSLAQKPFFSHSSWFLCLWSYTSQIHIMSGPIPWRLTQHYFSNWY